MKQLSIILVFLIFYPVIELESIDIISLEATTQHTCCNNHNKPEPVNENNHKHKKNDNGCSGQTCNPFEFCNCHCALYIMTSDIVDLSTPVVHTPEFFTYYFSFPNQLADSIWQPPECN